MTPETRETMGQQSLPYLFWWAVGTILLILALLWPGGQIQIASAFILIGSVSLVLSVSAIESDSQILASTWLYGRAVTVWLLTWLAGATVPALLFPGSSALLIFFLLVHILAIGVLLEVTAAQAMLLILIEWGMAGIVYLMVGIIWVALFR